MIRLICTDISDMTEAAFRALYEKASAGRRGRADRYRRPADAMRCLTAEALLRYVLGTGDFTEEKAPGGKPFLREYPDFHYNLSHAGRWVVLACGDSEVGVDVEKIRRDTDVEAIAGHFFAPEEQRAVRENPAYSRERFFEIWTSKESYVKYLGTGLRTDLTAFSVFSPEPEVRLFRRKLGEDYCLSLCTACDDYLLELLDLQRLL